MKFFREVEFHPGSADSASRKPASCQKSKQTTPEIFPDKDSNNKMTQPHQQALHALSGLQQVHELSIIKISEQISASQAAPNQRTSDVSSDAFENPSPASLEADLSHYKVRLLFCPSESSIPEHQMPQKPRTAPKKKKSFSIDTNTKNPRNYSPNSVSPTSNK